MRRPDGFNLTDLSLDEILMQRRGLRRELLTREDLQPVRIAVLGGSTTSEIVNLLDLWLLESGFSATFHQAEYGRYHVDAVHDTAALQGFKPDIVYVHTSVFDILDFPPLGASATEFQEHVARESGRFREIWASIAERIGCIVVQNNFEFPPAAVLGNLDAVALGGHTRFVTELNREFASHAEKNPHLLIQDVCSISARIGLQNWFDYTRWFSYKILTTVEGSRALAMSLCAMVRAIYGKTRKVLVLDLDNTLWGGVIGDDGVENILIGHETAIAEAFTAFQKYCLSLRARGVLLAVCSKNDDEVARRGFSHPDSVLKLEHISCFKANWRPKHENIEAIANELNLGVDSFVFVDDNPAERAIVKAQIGGIAVPNLGDDATSFAGVIEAGRYFEPVSVSKEDAERAGLYEKNAQRSRFQKQFADYGEYLESLEMAAEIDRFKPVYIERIAQLTNKTNQFNLTTRRYTLAEIQRMAADSDYLCIYGRLRDRFGDHGLISVVVGHRESDAMHVDLWLMSCRVLKRGMEDAMLDVFCKAALEGGAKAIVGTYIPSAKNSMVANFYAGLGFQPNEPQASGLPEGATSWRLELGGYSRRSRHINILELTHVQ